MAPLLLPERDDVRGLESDTEEGLQFETCESRYLVLKQTNDSDFIPRTPSFSKSLGRRKANVYIDTDFVRGYLVAHWQECI